MICKKILKSQSGAAAVEYGLITALIMVGAFAAIAAAGNEATSTLSSLGSSFAEFNGSAHGARGSEAGSDGNATQEDASDSGSGAGYGNGPSSSNSEGNGSGRGGTPQPSPDRGAEGENGYVLGKGNGKGSGKGNGNGNGRPPR